MEVVHVEQEDGGLHHVLEAGAGGGQDGDEVVQHPPGLDRDVALDERPGRGIEGSAPR